MAWRRWFDVPQVVANGSCMDASPGWPLVRELRLLFAVRDAGSVARLDAALSKCAALARLRRLHLSVFHDGRGRGVAARDKAECARLVAAWQAERSDVLVSFSQT